LLTAAAEHFTGLLCCDLKTRPGGAFLSHLKKTPTPSGSFINLFTELVAETPKTPDID